MNEFFPTELDTFFIFMILSLVFLPQIFFFFRFISIVITIKVLLSRLQPIILIFVFVDEPALFSVHLIVFLLALVPIWVAFEYKLYKIQSYELSNFE